MADREFKLNPPRIGRRDLQEFLRTPGEKLIAANEAQRPKMSARPTVAPIQSQGTRASGQHWLPWRRSGEFTKKEFVLPGRRAGGQGAYRDIKPPQKRAATGLLPNPDEAEAIAIADEENLLNQEEDRLYSFGTSGVSGPAKPLVAPITTEAAAPTSERGVPDKYTGRYATLDSGARVHQANPYILPNETMNQVAAYRRSLGPEAQTEFGGAADAEKYAVPEGAFAGSTPGGRGTLSTMPGFTEAEQTRLDQLHSEGYGTGQERPITGTPSVAMPKTSQGQREIEMRNAQVGGPSAWELNRMRGPAAKAAVAAHQAGVDRVAQRHAAEDEQATLRDVASIRAEGRGTTSGPDFMDQIARGKLDLDTQKAQATERQREIENQRAQDEVNRGITGELLKTMNLPPLSSSLLQEFSSRTGDPNKVASRMEDFFRANSEYVGILNDPDEGEQHDRILAELRETLGGSGG